MNKFEVMAKMGHIAEVNKQDDSIPKIPFVVKTPTIPQHVQPPLKTQKVPVPPPSSLGRNMRAALHSQQINEIDNRHVDPKNISQYENQVKKDNLERLLSAREKQKNEYTLQKEIGRQVNEIFQQEYIDSMTRKVQKRMKNNRRVINNEDENENNMYVRRRKSSEDMISTDRIQRELQRLGPVI